MTVILGRDKTFRFELVRDIGGLGVPVVNGYFNLMHPPESYSIKEAPRHSIMKLFGKDADINIDDFGDDNKTIRIKGTTGSPVSRRGYTSPISSLNGQEAMLEFRKRIINWRTNKSRNSATFKADDHKIKLYNYYDDEVYFVFITNFDMEKSSSKPLFYTYSIEMITIGRSKINNVGNILTFLNIMKKSMQTIQNAIDTFNEFLANNPVTAFIDDVVSNMQVVVDLSESLLNTIGALGPSTIDTITSKLVDIENLATNAFATSNKWADLFNNNYGRSYPIVFNDLNHSMTRLGLQWTKMGESIKSHSYRAEAIIDDTKTFNEYFDRTNRSSDDEITITLFGVGGKTLSEVVQLVREIHGIDTNAFDIADYNGLDGSVVPDGIELKIPISESGTELSEDNQVVTIDKINDYLGTDIKIINGIMQVNSQGDLGTINSTDNVIQAIDNRLNTELNAFLKMPSYGFDVKNTVGETTAVVFLKTVKMKYKEAVEGDPRITDVKDVVVSVGENGAISVTSTITVFSSQITHKFAL